MPQTVSMGERRHKVKKIPASERGKSIMGPVVRIVFAVFLVGGAVAAAQVAVKLLRNVLSPGEAQCQPPTISCT